MGSDRLIIFSFIMAIIMFILMIIVNGMANTLPLNGITTGDVSYKYPNLFQPSGITFSIWGIIYLLLLVYLVIQGFEIRTIQSEATSWLVIRLNWLFVATSLFNMAWLVAWHYDRMVVSTIIMIMLLVTLIVLVQSIPTGLGLVRSIFSVYLAWIVVATIANVTILLVKLGVPHEGQPAATITAIILLIGLTISLVWMIRESDLVFGLVVFWAYGGILLRHLRQEHLNHPYPVIIRAVSFSLICFLLVEVFLVMNY